MEARPITEFIDFGGYIDISAGYNNNEDLDTDYYDDGFWQVSSKFQLSCTRWAEIQPLIGLDTFSTGYLEGESSNAYDLTPYAGFDWKIAPGFQWQNRAVWDYFKYPNSESGTFRALKFSTTLKHLVTSEFSHDATYEWSKYLYPHRFIRAWNGSNILDEKRQDSRHRLVHSMRYNMGKLKLRLMNEFCFNESNDHYDDYYDYWLHRVKPTATYYITDKLYTSTSISAKSKFFKARGSRVGPGDKVHEVNMAYSASLYYILSQDITLGTTYTFTKNYSNDWSQEYSGSTISAGLTYAF
jgi:hypothetical protein